jgi:hypothetical protein
MGSLPIVAGLAGPLWRRQAERRHNRLAALWFIKLRLDLTAMAESI